MSKLSQYNGKEWVEIKAHDPTDKELLALIRPLIPEPIHGETPGDAKLLSLIRPLIPRVKDGKPPTEEELLKIIQPLIPKAPKDGKNGKDGSPDTPDEVVGKVNEAKKKIDPKQVEGLSDALKVVDNLDKFPVRTKGGKANLPVIQGAGVKLSDHVTAINFSTNLSAVYSGGGVITVTGTGGSGTISDEAYNATTWNGVTDEAPSKNAVRDKIESLGTGVSEELIIAYSVSL